MSLSLPEIAEYHMLDEDLARLKKIEDAIAAHKRLLRAKQRTRRPPQRHNIPVDILWLPWLSGHWWGGDLANINVFNALNPTQSHK